MEGSQSGLPPEDAELVLIRQGLDDTATMVGKLSSSRRKSLLKADFNQAGAAFSYTDELAKALISCMANLELRIVALESAQGSRP